MAKQSSSIDLIMKIESTQIFSQVIALTTQLRSFFNASSISPMCAEHYIPCHGSLSF